MIRESIMYMRY